MLVIFTKGIVNIVTTTMISEMNDLNAHCIVDKDTVLLGHLNHSQGTVETEPYPVTLGANLVIKLNRDGKLTYITEHQTDKGFIRRDYVKYNKLMETHDLVEICDAIGSTNIETLVNSPYFRDLTHADIDMIALTGFLLRNAAYSNHLSVYSISLDDLYSNMDKFGTGELISWSHQEFRHKGTIKPISIKELPIFDEEL